MQADSVDAVVVGAGPAGLSAALILGRARRTAIVCDDGRPRNARSHALHGFLTRDGEHPQRLRALAFDELRGYGIEVRAHAVVDAARVGGQFAVHLESEAVINARALLLATGVEDDVPAIEGLEALYGRSVFHCPYCDGWELRDQPLAAYGPGTNGYKLAVALISWSQDVVLFTGGGPPPSRHERATLAALDIPLRREPIVRLEGVDGRLERLILAGGASVSRRALFFKTGVRTAALGLLIGLPFSIGALRFVGSELGMTVGTAAIVAIVIMSAVVIVGSFASWLPARRAATVDPSQVLRSE